MFKFTDYIKEIWDVSKQKRMPVDVAYDMLRADIRIGHAENTEGMELGIDFEDAHHRWQTLTPDEKADCYGVWHDVKDIAYNELCNAYPDKEAMAEAVARAEAKIEARRNAN